LFRTEMRTLASKKTFTGADLFFTVMVLFFKLGTTFCSSNIFGLALG
jgi:hypothetical protein